MFDQAKLEWLSQEYIKASPGARLAELVRPLLAEAGLPAPDDARLAAMLETLRERAKTLREMVEVGRFYFERPAGYDDKARAEAVHRRRRQAPAPRSIERLARRRALHRARARGGSTGSWSPPSASSSSTSPSSRGWR